MRETLLSFFFLLKCSSFSIKRGKNNKVIFKYLESEWKKVEH